MAFDASAVLFGRDFIVYTTPWAAANTVPADTIAYGTAWGTPASQPAPWVDAGYTDGGLNFGIEITRGEIRVDQSLDPVGRPATGRNMTLTTNLAEFTATNIANAAGQGTVTTVAASAGVRGHNDLDISSTIVDAYRSIGYDIKAQDLEAFRIIGWKTLPSGGIAGAINPEDNATISLAASCFPDTSTNPARILKLRDVIPAA